MKNVLMVHEHILETTAINQFATARTAIAGIGKLDNGSVGFECHRLAEAQFFDRTNRGA